MGEYSAMVDALQIARDAARVLARHQGSLGSLALNPWEEQVVGQFLMNFLSEDYRR